MKSKEKIGMNGETKTHTAAKHRELCLIAKGIGALTIALSSATATHAQTKDSAEASVDRINSLEEVVVTARRREEFLSDVPVAVSVLTANSLNERGITTNIELQSAFPGLTMRANDNREDVSYSIRGQTLDPASGSQPGVLPYIDDFQFSKVSIGALYDLSAVQVIKGPQGTLFGRNATGGAVLFSTEKPKIDTIEGNVELRLGNFDARAVSGAVNFPLGDTVAVRLAGAFTRRDGYVKNLLSGVDLSNDDRNSVRASVLWEPSSRFSNTLMAQYDRSKSNGDVKIPWSVYSIGSTGPGPKFTPLISSTALFLGPTLDSLAGPGAFAALVSATPGATQGGVEEAFAKGRELGPWSVIAGGPSDGRSESFLVVDTATYELSENITLSNIAGYGRATSRALTDVDGTAFQVADIDIDARNEQFSNELKVDGETDDGKLDYVVGVYAGHVSFRKAYLFDVYDLGPIAGPLFGLPAKSLSEGEQESLNLGIFAQGNYALTEKLGATLGVRYSYEKVEHEWISGGGAFEPGTKQRQSVTEPSWQIGLDYKATDELMLYVTQRGSWRSAGFNSFAPPVEGSAAEGGNVFDVEEAKDVEIGAKFSGSIGEVPVRLNIAAYKQWVDGIQRVVNIDLPDIGLSSLTLNVPGTATFEGVEIDGEITPFSWLSMGFAAAFQKGSYASQASLEAFGQGISFDEMADFPERTASAFAVISLPLDPDIGTLDLRGDVYSQSSQLFSSLIKSTNPYAKLPEYTLANFRLEWGSMLGSQVSAALFIKNAFDEEYYVGGHALGSQMGFNTAIPGEPRTYGVELDYQF